jgi:hypothetical protein
MILLVILSILVFGYGLWYSNNKVYKGIQLKDLAYTISPIFMSILMFSAAGRFLSVLVGMVK